MVEMENIELIQKLLTAILIILSFILGLMISYGIYFSIDKSSPSDNKKSKLSDYSAVCFNVPPSIRRTWFTIGSTYSINADECITDDQGIPWSIYLHGNKPKEGLIVRVGSYNFVLIKKEGK